MRNVGLLGLLLLLAGTLLVVLISSSAEQNAKRALASARASGESSAWDVALRKALPTALVDIASEVPACGFKISKKLAEGRYLKSLSEAGLAITEYNVKVFSQYLSSEANKISLARVEARPKAGFDLNTWCAEKRNDAAGRLQKPLGVLIAA